MEQTRTAISGFHHIGIWPLDRSDFSEADFLPAATPDVALPYIPHTAPGEVPSTRSALQGTEVFRPITDEPSPTTVLQI
jgi:hypothetical protein